MNPTRSRRPVLIAAALAGGLLLACLACGIVSSLSKGTPRPAEVAQEATAQPGSPAPTGAQLAGAATSPTGEPAASATPGPTRTPEPTSTPAPTRTPAPTATLGPAQLGLTRSNPAPVGQAVLADDHFMLMVKGIKRGAEAWADIFNQNMFNSEPGEGQEYVLVTIAAGYAGDADETQQLSELRFRLVGEQGVIYTPPLMLVLDQGMDMELFGGGAGLGQVAFLVAEGEKDLVIIYSGTGTKARYLATGE